ncbi:MAG: M6 family metalloprotease domain-containing protein [Prevotella sp.]|nr:M6 family metalloprotease domain-containing protein [Prevotella sp.]
MKKLYVTMMLSLVAAVVFAVPALRGQWKLIKLTDGTQVKAQLVGDEHGHFWKTADGKAFLEDAATGKFVQVEKEAVLKSAQQRRAAANKKRAERRRVIAQPSDPVVGKKKGIVLLVQFKGETFEAKDLTHTMYTDMMNKVGYNGTEGYDKSFFYDGSVHDYFLAVSEEQLDLEFDVFGPIQLKNDSQYYGQNVGGMKANDKAPEEMVKEACDAVDDQVNFADYDWDGDGEVDQVVLIYSGLGENAGGQASTVWAHEYWISYTPLNNYKPLEYDGMKIDTYACSPEKTGYQPGDGYTYVFPAGIGVLCHEFSHCLGLPDMYDTGDQTNYGFNTYSVMGDGEYNGLELPGYTPCEYTAYERMYVGWRQPIELTDDIEVSDMKPIAKGGETYIYYNDNNPNEYFLLENRQHASNVAQTYEQLYELAGHFDCALEGDGLLITHVDFDQEIWENNYVNTTSDPFDIGLSTDHQRCALVAADNSYLIYNKITGDYDYDDIDGDCFPYYNNVGVLINNAFKDGTKGAEWYNDNSQGDRKLHAAITDITQNDDLSISFKFTKEKVEDGIKDVQTAAADQQRSSKLYDLGGREMKDTQAVGKGIYIRGGKKFVVK